MWDSKTFTKNHEGFERHGLVWHSFERAVASALVEEYASNDQFALGGRLIQSWASPKNFRPKDEPPSSPAEGGSTLAVNFHGQKRRNETHQSITDPVPQPAKKSNGLGCSHVIVGTC